MSLFLPIGRFDLIPAQSLARDAIRGQNARWRDMCRYLASLDLGALLKLALAASAVLGLALVTVLIGYFGFQAVGQAFVGVGWGMAALAAYQGLSILCAALAWRAVAKSAWTAPIGLFFWARWVREAVNTLMPVGQVGGDIVGARLLSIRGAGAAVAGASVVVDKTVEVSTQFLFSMLGVVLVLIVSADRSMAWTVAFAMMIFCPILVGFVAAQRMGLFRILERLLLRLEAKSAWLNLGDVSGLHDRILHLYGDRRGLLIGAIYHLVTWLLGVGELWLAVHFMGYEVTLVAATIIESLAQAVRSAGFFIPASLGVQEGGYLVFGVLFGLSPEVALALSLVRRVRQLLVGVPALLAWQCYEGRRLIVARQNSSVSDS
jgi:putative membrane protein